MEIDEPYPLTLSRLFLITRRLVLSDALLSRKRTFLTSPAWKTIPWQKHPETRSPEQQLYDTIAFVVGVVGELNSNTITLSSVLPEIEAELSQLCARRHAWEQRNSHSVFERPRDVDRSVIDGCETVLWFTSGQLATELLLYDCAMILFLSIVKGFADYDPLQTVLSRSEWPALQQRSFLVLPVAGMKIEDILVEIGRTLDYSLQQPIAGLAICTGIPVRFLLVIRFDH